MKIAVLYSSKTGYARRYAEMIASQVNGELFDLTRMRNLDKVVNYETIVYVASIIAGRMRSFNIVDKNIYDIEFNRKIFVGVGLTPPDELARAAFKKTNAPFGFENKIKFFLLRGGMDFNKLKGFDKILMKSIVKRLRENAARNEVEEEMYRLIVDGADFVKEENVAPIVEEILHPTPFVVEEEEPVDENQPAA